MATGVNGPSEHGLVVRRPAPGMRGRNLYVTVLDDWSVLVRGLEAVEVGRRLQAGNPADRVALLKDTRTEPETADLTEREIAILRLICRGMSNQDIAQTVYLSINTVKSYIRTAYRKMRVETRSQAILWGAEHGFVHTREVDPQASTDPS